VAWLRRTDARDAQPGPVDPKPATDPGDSPEALRRTLSQAVTFINRSSGQLPVKAVVDARRLTDTLAEIIDTSEVRPLDIYAVISVRATLRDYLPTTLRGFVAVAPELRDTARASGRTPVQSLLEQIEALQNSASQVLVAARNQDVDALMTQGSFLKTKFSGSDLDL
jgi:hypothetical protein